MHLLKLVLLLAGLLIAGQALAHKASHSVAAPQAPAGPARAQAGIHTAALLDGAGGRSALPTSAIAAAEAVEAIGKKHRYTHSH